MSTTEFHFHCSQQDDDVILVDRHNTTQLGEDFHRKTSSSSLEFYEVREDAYPVVLFPKESHLVVVPNGDQGGDRLASDSGYIGSRSNMVMEDADHHVPEMEIPWGTTDDDKDKYCFDLSDTVEGETVAHPKQNGRVSKGDNGERGNEILRCAAVSNECKTEVEFCSRDELNMDMDLTAAALRSSGLEGGREELAELGKHIVHSLLRLNYDDVLAAWCHDRSLWTDGKRPQTMPELVIFEDTAVDDFNLFPKPATSHPGIRTDLSGSRGREASVMRYREKKRSRVSSNKGRFAKRPYHTAMTY